MAIVIPTRIYTTGDNLTAVNYNDDRNEIIAGINSIDDAQINPTAGIQESKILFAGTGHGHAGGTDGQKVILSTSMDLTGLTAGQFLRVKAGGLEVESADITGNQVKSYGFYIGKDPLTVESDATFNPRVFDDMTVSRLSGKAKIAPVGSDLIVEVRKLSGTLIATLTIPAGNTQATTTTIASPSLSEGDILVVNVIQIGSGTAGSKLSLTLDCVIV